MHIAIVDNKRSPVRKSGAVAWEALGQVFTQHEAIPGAVMPDNAEAINAMKDGKAWMPAQIEVGPRAAERVQSISAVVLDIEASKATPTIQPPVFEQAVERVIAKGWRAYAHTTFQHRPDAPRYRLILAIDRDLKPGELKPLGLHIAALLGLESVTDKGALEPTRLYYLPRCPESELGNARGATIDGQPLDVDTLLAQIKPEPRAIPVKCEGLAADVLNHVHAPEEIRADLAQLDPGMGYEGWRNVLWAVAATALPEAEDLARAWSMRSAAKWDERAFTRTWNSYRRDGGITYGTVKHMLRGLGSGAATVNTNALEALRKGDAITRAQSILMPALEVTAKAYPLDALGPLVQAATDLAAGAQVSPAMAGQSLLAAAALLTQSTANVQSLDGSTKPLSLYCLTVAHSGDGKDTADRPALRTLHEHQRQEGQRYQLRRQAYEDAKAKRKKGEPEPLDPGRAPYRIASDLTIEGLRRSFDEGIASQGIFSTEAGAVLAGHAMTHENRTKTAANLCGLWDRGHISVVRGGGGRTERYGVRLSAHLLIQPAALGDVLADETLSGIGFWPRFLLAWPAPLEPRKHRPWQAEHSAAIRAYWQRCEALLAQPMPEECDNLPTLTLHANALKLLAEFFDRMEQEARKGDLMDVRAFALRSTELACRIAGVLTAFEGKQQVDASSANSGIRLAEHSLSNWLDALGGKSDPVPGWAFTLYRWLVERSSVAVRDIPRIGPASVRPANRRDRAVERLTACGLAHIEGDKLIAVGVLHDAR
ncbi:MAG: DUF3987 domain-containing protein [Pseudomonadota bacterium]